MAIKLTGTGDMSQLTKELERLQGQVVKLSEANTKASKDGAEGSDKMIAKVMELGKAYAGPIASMLSLGGAIKTVVSLHDQHIQRLTDLAAKYKEVDREAVKGFAQRGQLQFADEILTRMKASGQGRSVNAQALSAVAGGDPIRFGESSRAALERQLPLAVEVAKQMPYADDQLGEQAGRFQRMLPGRSPQEIMRMVQYAREHVGDNMEALTSQRMVKFVETMKSRGTMSGEQALGTAIGMLLKGQRPDKLLQLADEEGGGKGGITGGMGGMKANTADLQRAMAEGKIITDEFSASASSRLLPTEALKSSAIGVQTQANVEQEKKIAQVKAMKELEAKRRDRMDQQIELERAINLEEKGWFGGGLENMVSFRASERSNINQWFEQQRFQGVSAVEAEKAGFSMPTSRAQFIDEERRRRQVEDEQLSAMKEVVKNQRAAANLNTHVEQ